MAEYSKPTGGQLLGVAPSRQPNNFPFRTNEICGCDPTIATNATETARVATIPFSSAITLRWYDVTIKGVSYRIDLNNLLMTPATQADDIAKLRENLVNGFGGVGGSLFGGSDQLTIAVVATDLVVTITSVADYLPSDIQTATATINFV